MADSQIDNVNTPEKMGSFFKKPHKGKDVEKSSELDGNETPPAELPPEPVSIFQMFKFSTKFELLIDAIGLVTAIAAGAGQPMMTLIFGKLTTSFVNFSTVVDQVSSGDPTAQHDFPQVAADFRKEASKNALWLVVIGCGMFVCTYLYMTIWVYTGEVNAKRIRERYLKAVLRQDIQFFDKVGAGEIATRIQTDTHMVQQGISEKVPIVVSFISSFLSAFILAYLQSWRLALAMTSILPCLMVTGVIMNKFTSKYMQLSLHAVASGGSLAEEVFSSIRSAQAFGIQRKLSTLYDQQVETSYKVNKKASVSTASTMATFMFVIYAAYALAFYFGTTLILDGHATPGDITNVIMAILIGSFSLVLLGPELQALAQGSAAAAKLYATIDRIPQIDSADSSGLKLERVKGEITLENVKFNYPARPHVPIVKDLSLTFKAGQTAALVGASGSGKSTVVSLVERFYDPLSGVVRLDGHDLKTLNLKWLRSQIGLVSQEPTLFATTISGNVAHGLIGTQFEHASAEEKFSLIKEACVKANADGFISKLPNGYDTLVGERGFLLSGGQKQRIAIARAIVSDPRILLLDEATSALDTQSEGIVQDALDRASAGRTTITIAHRLSTIKDADVIFVMGDGVVLEQGTHEQLLSNEGGPYARLVQSQKLREANQAAAGPDEDSSVSGSQSEDNKEKEKEVPQEDLMLPRSGTSRSLASDIIKAKLKDFEEEDRDVYGFLYIFKTMGIINKQAWKAYFLGSLAAIVNGCIYPSYGFVFSKGITSFNLTGHEGRVAGDRNALWFFVIALIAFFSTGIQNYCFTGSASALVAKLRKMSFRAILRQDIEFFDEDQHNTGQLTSELSDNPEKVNGLAGITLGTMISSTTTLVAGLIVGLVFAWKVAVVGLACTPLLVGVGFIRLRVVVLKDKNNKKAHGASAQLASEAAGAIRTVAALTREDDCCALYSESLEGPLRRSNRTAIWANALYALSQAMIFFVIGLVFWWGARLVSELEFSTFHFFVGLMCTTFAALQAGNIFAFVPDVSSAQSGASDIIKLFKSVPEIDAESSEGKSLDIAQVKGEIRFDGVHFRYPTRSGVRVLRGLSVHIRPGTYVAFVGQSGCGKSTIIQMIERFYDPLIGDIYLDGERIADLNVSEYRKAIALVSQEPTLYSGTVRFNILLGAVKPESEVTQEELEDACRKANILDFIKSLPEGFDTEVGGKGSQLSGGQKQRIAIARALLRNPKVLLLDEATSALDSNSEKIVQEALDQASKGRTTIAIAHRLSTIQNADCIYFIKEGQVSEAGTHDELIRKGGDYYEFVQLQALSKRN